MTMLSVKQRGMPAKGLVVAALLLLLSGCSSVPHVDDDEIPPQRTLESVYPTGADRTGEIDQYDPFEGLNRGVYRFNAWFDDYVFLPLAGAYSFVMPDVVEQGIHNFMRNVGDLENLLNAALQLKGKATLETAGRLLTNTTIGVLGFWDAATEFGLVRHDEDFGQTLGHYGVGAGPYLVLPILGPSSLRDAGGLVVDTAAFTAIDPLFFDHNEDAWEYGYYATRALDTRNHIGFRYYETGSPFEYELVRLMYLKKREIEIAR